MTDERHGIFVWDGEPILEPGDPGWRQPCWCGSGLYGEHANGIVGHFLDGDAKEAPNRDPGPPESWQGLTHEGGEWGR